MAKIKGKISKAKPQEATKGACPDCTVLVADGGKSEFRFPKAGLLNEKTLCSTCEGHGIA